MKPRTLRWVVVIASIVLCSVVGGLVSPQPLINRGIVVGLGVDKTDEGYEVVAQLAVAGEKNDPGAANKYVLATGKGKTLALALDNIAHVTAYNPSYFHCHVLMFGERVVKESINEAVRFLFVNDEVTDDVMLVGVEGSAKEALEKSVPVQGAVSVYLQQEIKTNVTMAGTPFMTLKKFVSNLESEGYSNYMPWVVTLKAPPTTGNSEGDGGKQNYIFDTSSIVLFGSEGSVSVQDRSASEALSLAQGGAGLIMQVPIENGNMSIAIKQGYHMWGVTKDGKVTLRAIYYVKMLSQNIKSSNDEVGGKIIESESKRYIRGLIASAVQRANEGGADLFSLKGRYLKKYGKGKPLPQISFHTQLTVKARCD